MFVRLGFAIAVLLVPAGAQTLKVPDDFATIQEAVDAAPNGATIKIAANTYGESVVIDGRAGLTLRGSGKAVIDPPGDDPGLQILNSSAIEVRNLAVVNATDLGISVDNCVVVSLLKCRVENVLGRGIQVFGTLHLTLDGCRVLAFGNTGIDVGGFSGEPENDDAVIRNCFIDGRAGGNFGLVQNGDNALIERNEVLMDPDFPAIDLGGTNHFLARVLRNRTIGDLRLSRTDSFSERNLVEQGSLELGGDGLVSTRDRVVDGLIALEFADGMTVRDAKSSGPEGEGVLINGMTDLRLENLKVTGSTVRGIKVAFSDGLIIVGLSLKKGANGLEVDSSSDVHVTAATVSGSAGVGVELLGTGSTISGCKITGSAGDGLHLGPSSSSNEISACKVKGSGGFDLNDEGNNTIAEDCVFGTVAP